MNDELIEKVEALKTQCVFRSTKDGVPDEDEYKRLRSELLANSRVSAKLPEFVRSCRGLPEFWSFIKTKSDGYDGRRKFIWQAFDPVLTMLETEPFAPGNAGITATVQAISSAYIQEIWQKALERRATDPEGAITASRTLL